MPSNLVMYFLWSSSIGPLAIRWYALSYIVGFILFTILGRRRIAQGNSVFTKETLDDFLTWGILGVILGGRIGYVLFYKFSDYLANPLDIFKVWEGGMSFHGGFLGVVVAMWLFGRKHNISILKLMDTDASPLLALMISKGMDSMSRCTSLSSNLWPIKRLAA